MHKDIHLFSKIGIVDLVTLVTGFISDTFHSYVRLNHDPKDVHILISGSINVLLTWQKRLS